MSILQAITVFVFLSVGLLGYVLIRAARTGKIWFLAIEPTRQSQPILFWWCTVWTLWAFVGGLVGAYVLALMSVSEVP